MLACKLNIWAAGALDKARKMQLRDERAEAMKKATILLNVGRCSKVGKAIQEGIQCLKQAARLSSGPSMVCCRPFFGLLMLAVALFR